jgi:hypothetical protein
MCVFALLPSSTANMMRDVGTRHQQYAVSCRCRKQVQASYLRADWLELLLLSIICDFVSQPFSSAYFVLSPSTFTAFYQHIMCQIRFYSWFYFFSAHPDYVAQQLINTHNAGLFLQ